MTYAGVLRRFSTLVERFWGDRRGNYAIITALAAAPLLTAVGVTVEFANASRVRSDLQQRLDAAVLAGARERENKVRHAEDYFSATYDGATTHKEDSDTDEGAEVWFELGDGVLDGWARRPLEPVFLSALAAGKEISIHAQARFADGLPHAPCLTVLSDKPQAMIVNTGASLDAAECEIHVHSRSHEALVMNANSSLDVERTCVASQSVLHNGGKIGGLETGCKPVTDAYAQNLPVPTVPANCTTSGVKSGTKHVLRPGKHCLVTFDGVPTVTFEPGLHVIEGVMTLNVGATVIAEGVTFYFPDVHSELRANGALSLHATAPQSGPYKDILMFERTSSTANNAAKTKFVFNGSVGEHLEGLIYLPNRDVTYNSKTNIEANRVTMVFNSLIVNSASWKVSGHSDGSDPNAVYLSK